MVVLVVHDKIASEEVAVPEGARRRGAYDTLRRRAGRRHSLDRRCDHQTSERVGGVQSLTDQRRS